MFGSEYYLRLAAALVVAGALGATIAQPRAGRAAVERVAAIGGSSEPFAARACAQGAPALEGPFANLEDILSISPLGGVTAPGEQLPAPAIRINTKKGGSVFERRPTAALAASKSDITAIERRTIRSADGAALRENWSLRFTVCEDVTLVYDDLDEIKPALIAAAGGLDNFTEIGGPDHLAVKTRIRVKKGEAVGAGDGFDVLLEDARATPAALERPERYRADSYAEASAISAPAALLETIKLDASRIQCPLDYLPEAIAPEWKTKLGDAWGMRRAKGDETCRTALVDVPGSAQGAWFTDAAHNGRTSKVSAVALAPDAIDPARLIFALHGRVRSLTPDMVGLNPMLDEARAEAARDFLSFEQGDGRINPSFEKVKPGEIYCFEGLRANFVGPKINGVLLLSVEPGDAAPLMKIEARADALSCIDLEEPWAFSGAQTTFYR